MNIKIVKSSQHKDSVYCGRPSLFGNPFTVKEYGRGNCIGLYRNYFTDKISEDNNFKEVVIDLGLKCIKDGYLKLGCHCAPNPCHTEVIKEWLENNWSEVVGNKDKIVWDEPSLFD